MAISKEGLAKLELVKTVNEAIDLFLNEWQLKAVAAVSTFKKPDDGDANRQWWIAFAGNMLWAWTVFVPGGGAVAVAASLLGATLAAGAASKLKASEPQGLGTDEGKAMIMESLFSQVAKARTAFQQVSPAWSVNVLLPAIFNELDRQLKASSVQYKMRREAHRRRHPDTLVPRPEFFLQDDELHSWFNGNDLRKGDEWVKSFVWYRLMFLVGKVKYEFRDVELFSYFQRLLSILQEQFEAQHDIYKDKCRRFFEEYRDSTLRAEGPGSGFGSHDRAHWAADAALREYKVAHPFIFKPFYGITPKGDALTAVYSTFNVKVP